MAHTAQTKRQISIDPRCKLVYATFYLAGLKENFGLESIKFSSKPFVDLEQNTIVWDFDHYMALHVAPDDIRIIIDYGDKSEINIEALEWSDVYAKINLNHTSLMPLNDRSRDKIYQIGPSFGFNNFSTASLYNLCLMNWTKSLRLTKQTSFREFLTGYNWTRARCRETLYQASESQPDFIFHASRFYKAQSHGDITNAARKAFILSAKDSSSVKFEGGLVGVPVNRTDYRAISTDKYLPHNEYVKLTARSAIVFNTPAAWGCHGWKLGEYFALGKAIITTDFVNTLPRGMVHGKNIHICSSPADIQGAVHDILANESYRIALQNNARKFYDESLCPKRVIERIFKFLEPDIKHGTH